MGTCRSLVGTENMVEQVLMEPASLEVPIPLFLRPGYLPLPSAAVLPHSLGMVCCCTSCPATPPTHHPSPPHNLTGVGYEALGPDDPALASQIRQYYKGFVSLMNNAELNYIRSGLNFHIPISHLHKDFPLAASWGRLCQLRGVPNEIIPAAGEVGFRAARPLGEKVKSQSSNYLSP